MSKGFLYVANRQKFVNEALISVKSLKRFNREPVCLICTAALNTEEVQKAFDSVIEMEELINHTYLSKVVGMQNSPWDHTIFLDSDTFITDKISELFEILELVDFATTLEQKLHTTNIKDLNYKNIFPEFNTGVIVYRKNSVMEKVLADWLQFCRGKKM